MRPASPEAMKEAMKQGKRPNEDIRMKKNISMDNMGDKLGRVHLGKQDLKGMQTRKMKGLKRRAGGESDEEPDVNDMEVDEVDEDEEEESHKKARKN